MVWAGVADRVEMVLLAAGEGGDRVAVAVADRVAGGDVLRERQVAGELVGAVDAHDRAARVAADDPGLLEGDLPLGGVVAGDGGGAAADREAADRVAGVGAGEVVGMAAGVGGGRVAVAVAD